MKSKCLIQKEFYHKQLFGKADKSPGTHTMGEIFIMKGTDVRRGVRVSNLGIMDVTPTILYYLGVPVADDTDGRVLSDLFTKSYQDANPVKYVKAAGASAPDQEGVYGGEDLEKRRKILRDLGYIG